MTDFCILLFIGYRVFSGLSKGVIRRIIELALLCFALIITHFIYKTTQNFILGIAAFTIISIVFSTLVKRRFRALTAAARPDYNKISVLNSFLGGIFGLLEGVFWSLLILLAIAMLPDKTPYISPVKTEIESSKSFKIVAGLIEKHGSGNPLTQRKLGHSIQPKDLERLSSNEKMKAILSDEETLEQLRSKDILAVMNNPKIIDALGDMELMKEIIKIYSAEKLSE